jgi:hypothetical protein
MHGRLHRNTQENSHNGDNHQTTIGLMVSGYYDFEFGSPFVPSRAFAAT